MKKSIVFHLLALAVFCCGKSQSPEEVYLKPLSVVVTDIERIFDVKLISSSSEMDDFEVDYASWKFTFDINSTLDNVLKPIGWDYQKVHGKSNIYEIFPFRYYRRSVEEGDIHLRRLLDAYGGPDGFENRKVDLRKCILDVLGFSISDEREPPNAIMGKETKMDKYIVQNVAVESIPGYYVTGTLYKPKNRKGPHPVILSPHGHFYNEKDPTIPIDSGRYRADMQIRCATLARMGALVLSYDMYAWGESVLFTGGHEFHNTGFALPMQSWNSIRALDFLLALPMADKYKVGVTGASGGGTQTFLLGALDERVTATVPTVMVSSSFYGGCPCESGLPIHDVCNGNKTNNVELSALMSPKTQLLISEDCDWTTSFPEIDFPYLQKVYGFYDKLENVHNVHLPDAPIHDYSYPKRDPMYRFFAKTLKLDLNTVLRVDDKIDESHCTIQKPADLRVFGSNQEIPKNALRSHDDIVRSFRTFHSGN